MNLTFTKVRLSSLHEQALTLLSLPTPSPTRASGAIPHFTLNSRGNRHQSLWRCCSLIRMRVMEMERRQVSTSSVCSLPPSASSVQPKKGFDASWRALGLGGNLASGNLTTLLYANHPKEEVVQTNRPTEISSGHKKQY